MDAGEFNTRIEIRRLTKTSDSYGGTTSTITLYDTIWAKKSDVGGNIESDRGRSKTKQEIELIIRKKSADQINNDDLVKIEGETGDFRIVSIFDNIHKYYTQLKAVRLK